MFKHTQTICRQQPTDFLSVFDHFVELAVKGLNKIRMLLKQIWYIEIIHVRWDNIQI